LNFGGLKCLLIRINKTYKDTHTNEMIYECTRGIWKLGPDRAKANIAFAVYQGIIKGAFEIVSWHPAGTTAYQYRIFDAKGLKDRWEFLGKNASQTIIDNFVGKNISYVFEKGDASPVRYINIKD
jgi:hypothetical protein